MARRSRKVSEEAMVVETQRNKLLMVVGLVVAIIGLVIVVLPDLTTSVIAILVGLCLAAAGISSVLAWFKAPSQAMLPKYYMLTAVVEIIVAIVFILNPVILGNLVLWLCIICLVVYGLSRIYRGKQEKELSMSGWMVTLVTGVLAVIAGLALIVKPDLFSLVVGLFVVILGISLIFAGYKPANASEPAQARAPKRARNGRRQDAREQQPRRTRRRAQDRQLNPGDDGQHGQARQRPARQAQGQQRASRQAAQSADAGSQRERQQARRAPREFVDPEDRYQVVSREPRPSQRRGSYSDAAYRDEYYQQ